VKRGCSCVAEPRIAGTIMTSSHPAAQRPDQCFSMTGPRPQAPGMTVTQQWSASAPSQQWASHSLHAGHLRVAPAILAIQRVPREVAPRQLVAVDIGVGLAVDHWPPPLDRRRAPRGPRCSVDPAMRPGAPAHGHVVITHTSAARGHPAYAGQQRQVSAMAVDTVVSCGYSCELWIQL
jgi:hypothetical protein